MSTTTATPTEVTDLRNSVRAGRIAKWLDEDGNFLPARVTDEGRVSYDLHRGVAGIRVLFEESAVVTVQTGEWSSRSGYFYDESSAQFTGNYPAGAVIRYIDSLI